MTKTQLYAHTANFHGNRGIPFFMLRWKGSIKRVACLDSQTHFIIAQ